MYEESRFVTTQNATFLMHSFAADLDVIIHLIGLVVFVLLLIVGCVFVIIFAFDMISLTRLHKYLRKYYARRLFLHDQFEVDQMNETDLFINLEQFQEAYTEAKTSTEKIVWLEGADVFRTEIGRRIALKEKAASKYKSFLPFLFIPYVDGVAQFIGYCILIPLALGLLGAGIFFTVLSIKKGRYKRKMKAQNARIIDLHKELDLSKISSRDLVFNLMLMQKQVRSTPESDPAYPGFVEIVNSIQNELAQRPWGTR